MTLDVTGPGGTDQVIETDLITVTEPAPVAAFTASATAGDAPFSVDFTDDSTGLVDTWAWDFGDGNTSALQDPSHTFASAGTFTVTLEVTGPGGTDTIVQPDLIEVDRQARMWFVDQSATAGLADGLSWENAFLNLGDAISAAGAGDTIRVANGTYRPDQGANSIPGDRDARFDIDMDLRIEGGYVGLGAVDPDFRNPADHITVLDGDLLGDDGEGFANFADNAFQVLVHQSGSLDLSGLTVRGGNNDRDAGFETLSQTGSGLVSFAAAQDLRIEDCIFEENLSMGGNLVAGGGGSLAVLALAGDLTLSNTRFAGNRISNSVGRTAFGGAVSVLSVAGSARVSKCEFEANEILLTGGGLFTQARGGALFAADTGATGLRVEDCLFLGNSSVCDTGATGGACDTVSAVFTRCRFEGNLVDGGAATGTGGGTVGGAALLECWYVGNRAQGVGQGSGGGLSVLGADVRSCVVLGNSASGSPGGLQVFGFGGATISHCTISDNTAEGVLGGRSVGGLQDATLLGLGPALVQQCLLRGNLDSDLETDGDAQLFLSPGIPAEFNSIQDLDAGTFGATNDDLDPLLRDALGPDGIAGTGDEDPRLSTDSPSIEIGDNAALPADAFDSDGDGDQTESTPFDAIGAPRISDGDSDGLADVDRGALEIGATAAADDIDPGALEVLLPEGGLGDRLFEPVAEIENLFGVNAASATASSVPAIPATARRVDVRYGAVLETTTSLADGDLISTVSVPFVAADLGGADPTTVATRIELHRFDPALDEFSLAVEGNTADSPGFAGPEGDYTIEVGPGAPVLSLDLGDHGIFWDPILEVGFAWARVDYAGEFTARLFVDCNGNGLSDDEELTSGFSVDANQDGVLDACQELELRADVTTLSVTNGGTQNFEIATEEALPSAIRFYLVLASASGTLPGLPVDGVLVPLNFDALVTGSLAAANGPIWQATFGALPANGEATASFNLPGGAVNPALIGSSLHHATLILTVEVGGIVATGATNAAVLEFVP